MCNVYNMTVGICIFHGYFAFTAQYFSFSEVNNSFVLFIFLCVHWSTPHSFSAVVFPSNIVIETEYSNNFTFHSLLEPSFSIWICWSQTCFITAVQGISFSTGLEISFALFLGWSLAVTHAFFDSLPYFGKAPSSSSFPRKDVWGERFWYLSVFVFCLSNAL